MVAPTPTAMPARYASHPPAIPAQMAGPVAAEEILFTDTMTGQIGVVRQRRGDGLFVFHPRSADAAQALVEEPGRFRATPPGHDVDDREHADQDDDRRESRRRRRARPRGHRGGGRGRHRR